MKRYERTIYATLDTFRDAIDRARSCSDIDNAEWMVGRKIGRTIAEDTREKSDERYNALAFAHREVESLGEPSYIWGVVLSALAEEG